MFEKLIKEGLLKATLDTTNHINDENHLPQSYSLANGTQVEVLAEGIVKLIPNAIHGEQTLVLSAGIHGNETAPIELVDQLLLKILQQHYLLTKPLLIIFGHPPAMRAGVREINFNLNRLFSGKHTQQAPCYETKRAALLEHLLIEFAEQYPNKQMIHLDLHTAIRGSKYEKFAIYPFQHGGPWQREQLALLQACGVNCVLFSHQATSTFSSYSAKQFSAWSYTVELGKARPFGENQEIDLTLLYRTLQGLLFNTDKPGFDWQPDQQQLFMVEQELFKSHDDLAFNFSDSQQNFTEYPPYTVLGSQGGKDFAVADKPLTIVFPNLKVLVGQRALLLVKQLNSSDIQTMIENHQVI